MSLALGNAASFSRFLPDLCLAGGALAALLLPVIFRRVGAGLAAVITLISAAAAIVATIFGAGPPAGLFGGLVARDPFADFFRILFTAAAALVALLATRSRD